MQREDIILAAAQIFRQKGYHAASMQDIAESVRLQKGSLYHHIRSKQEVLLEILDRALDALIADLQPIVESGLPPAEKLQAAMRTYIGRMTQNSDLAAVLLLEHRSLDPKLRKAHMARRDRFEGLWRQIVQEGVRLGDFLPMDASVVAFALLGVQNWLITWYREGGRYRPDDLAAQFAQLFLSGLARDSRPA
ncbi:MAG: TetR/AcrR family transcriptional regulator [Anaerolineales bacterium]